MEERQMGTRDLAAAGETHEQDASRREMRPADEPMAREELDTSMGTDTDAGAAGSFGQIETDGSAADGALGDRSESEPLLPAGETRGFTHRWQEIQTSFVDEPRQAVERADTLVAEVMQQVAASFADARQNLERQWDSGDDVSTEDLRVALTRYRSFFDRLLAA